jgi:hypothetical protein
MIFCKNFRTDNIDQGGCMGPTPGSGSRTGGQRAPLGAGRWAAAGWGAGHRRWGQGRRLARVRGCRAHSQGSSSRARQPRVQAGQHRQAAWQGMGDSTYPTYLPIEGGHRLGGRGRVGIDKARGWGVEQPTDVQGGGPRRGRRPLRLMKHKVNVLLPWAWPAGPWRWGGDPQGRLGSHPSYHHRLVAKRLRV